MRWVGFEPQKQYGSTAEIRRTAVRRFATGKNFQVAQQIHRQSTKVLFSAVLGRFFIASNKITLNN